MKNATEKVRKTVGSVIVNQKSSEYLLLKRADEEYLAGLWELPSGKVEESESLTEALIREVKEETGLTIHNKPHFIDTFEYRSQNIKHYS